MYQLGEGPRRDRLGEGGGAGSVRQRRKGLHQRLFVGSDVPNFEVEGEGCTTPRDKASTRHDIIATSRQNSPQSVTRSDKNRGTR